MHSKSWFIGIVLLSALCVSLEAVTVEASLRVFLIDVFLVTAVPCITGGLLLVLLKPSETREFIKILARREWIFLILLSAASAIGALLWFDAVGRIGAGKEAILGGGSSEVLFVVILSAVFLGERLNRWEITGSFLVLIGVFLVLIRQDTFSLHIGLGEIEAICSSFLLGASAVMAAKLLRVHNATPLSAIELIICGIILLFVVFMIGFEAPADINGWLLILVLGIFPAVGVLTYFIGLQGIGASITSVLFALSGIMTVGVQILVIPIFPDVYIPENIVFALLGGAVAFLGVYLIQKKPSSMIPVPGGHKI